MMRGSLGGLALVLLQASPASSFGGVPLARPSTKPTHDSATPATTSSAAVSPTRFGWAHMPVGEKSGLLSHRNRSQKGGRGGDNKLARFAAKGTADGDDKNKKSAVAEPAAKKKSSSSSMGGWDWGFKSTPKKTAAKPSGKKVAAAAAESKAKQEEEAKVKKEAEEAAVAEDAAAAEAAEKQRKADAKAKADQEKAQAKMQEEEEAAALKAARIAQAKRAEEIAAMARGDAPKTSKKKADRKPTLTKEKAEPANATAAEPVGASSPIEVEPAKAKPAKAKPTKAETAPAKTAPKKKSSGGGGGMEGWDWGFTSTPKKTAEPPAEPATGAAKTKAKKPTAADKAEKVTQELASAAAAAAATVADEAEAAGTKLVDAAKAKADEEKAAAVAKAEEIKAAGEKAKKEVAAARAAQEKRAEAIAAKARGDMPEPKKKKAPAKAAAPATAPAAKKEESADGNKGQNVETVATKEKDAEVTKPKKKKPAAAKKEKESDGGKEEVEGDAVVPTGVADAVASGSEKKGEGAKKATKNPVKGETSGSDGGGGGIWDFFGGPKTSSPKPNESSGTSLTLTKPETIVVVTGATGRVGSLAVRRLLELYPQVLVRAVVNDYAKGCRLLEEDIDKYGIKLEVVTADLGGSRSVAKAVEGASAVVFCASGFAQNLSPIQRLANAVRLTLNPSSVADVEGVREVATALKATKKVLSRASKAAQDKANDVKGDSDKEGQEPQPLYPEAPRFVLLSSAAVTRPDWSDEEKALYPLAADVPIVKLNPLNILTVKADGEKELREVGIPYAVVRPCGLNDDHPKGRPLFSVGDTAAGRICREDVADVLVRCLATPEATGKTFEVQSLPGFEKVASSVKTNNKGGIDQALAGLPTDEALKNDPNMLKSFRQFTYPVLTQLRPVPLSSQASQEKGD